MVTVVGVAGCAAAEDPPTEGDSAYSTASALYIAAPRYLGNINTGDTKTSAYSNPPRLRAYGFAARGGDVVTVDVTSATGNAMAWITTLDHEILAANRDARATTNYPRVVYKVPKGRPLRRYHVAFRDEGLSDATFRVTLSVQGTPVVCIVAGTTYQPGDRFSAPDNCNVCTCNANGNVDCTQGTTCVCNPEAEPWRNYVGTPSTCATIRYTCPAGRRSFQNACGCGCELIAH
jgi:hypothetical protein